MLEDLDNLSHRISQLVQLNHDIRAQNAALQAELGQRDTIINERNAIIGERDAAIDERNALIRERDAALAERDAQLAQRDAALADNAAALDQRDATIGQLRDTIELAQIRVEDVLARLPGKPAEPDAQADDDTQAGAHQDDLTRTNDLDQTEPGGADGDARRAMHGTH